MTEFLEVNHEMYTADILVYLARNGTQRKMDLYNGVSHNPRMPQKLRILEDAGLIVEKPMLAEDLRAGKCIELTDKGFTVASHLVDAEEAMR